MSLIYAYQNSGHTLDLTILDGAGATITPGANDKLRITIGHDSQTAKLTFTSDAATANGSSITKNSPSSGLNRLRLDASDLAFDAGTYSLNFEYFDNADASEYKMVSKQVFVLEAGFAGLADISEVLLELGLSGTVTDEQRAITQTAMARAYGAIRRHLKYDPVQRVRTEYYPQGETAARSGGGVWDVTDTQARFERAGGGDVLFVQHIPIRSIASLAVDYDGRFDSKSGAFATNDTEGTDYWPQYDGVDDAGAKLCRDGMIRRSSGWPSQPGSVKIVYTAGYSQDELRGKDLLVDASPIFDAMINESVRRAKRALLNKKQAAGFTAGPLQSERLGDYNYAVAGSSAERLFGGLNDLSHESKEALEDFVNMGWMIAG